MNPSQLTAALSRLTQEITPLVESLYANPPPNAPPDLSALRSLPTLYTANKALYDLHHQARLLDLGIKTWCRNLFPAPLGPELDGLDDMDDDTILSVYLYCKVFRAPRDTSRPSPSQIMSAIGYADRYGFPSAPGTGYHPALVFSDHTKISRHALAVPKNLPENAIRTDNVAEFRMGMALVGKQLSPTLVRHLIGQSASNILEHLVRNKSVVEAWPPDKLLQLVLATMNGPGIPTIVAAIEDTFPGTVATAKDADGHDALFHSLRFHMPSPQNAFPPNALTDLLVSRGANPGKVYREGFSYRAMSRLIRIVLDRLHPDTSFPALDYFRTLAFNPSPI